MSALSLRLPDSLHRKVRELAEREDVSINQLIATAVAEKMSALLTVDYIEQRAKRGSGAHFLSVLRRVRDATPLPGDEWPVSDAAAVRERPKAPYARKGRPKTARLKRKA